MSLYDLAVLSLIGAGFLGLWLHFAVSGVRNVLQARDLGRTQGRG